MSHVYYRLKKYRELKKRDKNGNACKNNHSRIDINSEASASANNNIIIEKEVHDMLLNTSDCEFAAMNEVHDNRL